METCLPQQPSKQYSRHNGYAVVDSKPANILSVNGYIYVELLALFVFVPQAFMLRCLTRHCLLAYIRTKRVKGLLYAYLVQSEWDKRRGLSIQHNIKYLGRADGVEINDIPEEYRNDPKVLSFLSLLRSKKKARKPSIL
jgi:hypothetical protein